MSTAYRAPNGEPIIGTLESLTGVAIIKGINPGTGEPIYAGETDIWWDEQKTVLRDGKTVFVDDSGNHWMFDQLTATDD